MKKAIFITALLTIIAAASVSRAQHVKVFDGRSGVVLTSSDTQSLTALTGQTIRLRIAVPNNRSDTNDIFVFRGDAGHVQQGSIPCSSSASVTRTSSTGLSAGKVNWSYNRTEDEHNYLIETDRAWKGTCRMFVVQLSNGAEYRVRVRFR